MGFDILLPVYINEATRVKVVIVDGSVIIKITTSELYLTVGDKYDILLGNGNDKGKFQIKMHENGCRTIKKYQIRKINHAEKITRGAFEIRNRKLLKIIPRVPFSIITYDTKLINEKTLEIDLLKAVKEGQSIETRKITKLAPRFPEEKK